MITTPYDDLIQQTANLYGFAFDLLQAQVMVESSADPNAFRYEPAYFDRYINGKSSVLGNKYGPLAACSYGLLQILLETALEHGFAGNPWDLFTPRVGLFWGGKYLQTCLQRASGDPHQALAFYNGTGPAAAAYADLVFHRAGRSA